jgi:hypothetical protein
MKKKIKIFYPFGMLWIIIKKPTARIKINYDFATRSKKKRNEIK